MRLLVAAGRCPLDADRHGSCADAPQGAWDRSRGGAAVGIDAPVRGHRGHGSAGEGATERRRRERAVCCLRSLIFVDRYPSDVLCPLAEIEIGLYTILNISANILPEHVVVC